jgi:hypothetical protein
MTTENFSVATNLKIGKREKSRSICFDAAMTAEIFSHDA